VLVAGLMPYSPTCAGDKPISSTNGKRSGQRRKRSSRTERMRAPLLRVARWLLHGVPQDSALRRLLPGPPHPQALREGLSEPRRCRLTALERAKGCSWGDANIILGPGASSAVAFVPGPFSYSPARAHQEVGHVWGMQLKQHTTPCASANSLFTGGVCRGMLLCTLSSGPDLLRRG
jgi:hypothetical protein